MKKGSCTVHLSLRKIELFNLLHRHLLPGPQLECLRPLVQQHIESVESRTSGFSGKAQQFCLFRIVDHIGNDQVFMEKDGSLMMERLYSGACPQKFRWSGYSCLQSLFEGWNHLQNQTVVPYNLFAHLMSEQSARRAHKTGHGY